MHVGVGGADPYRPLVDVLPQLAWVAEADGRHGYFNPPLRAYLGTEDATPQNWLTTVHPDDVDAARDAWQTAVRNCLPLDVEFRLRGADGAYRWFRSRASALRDPDGRVVRWYGVLDDVHDARTLRETQAEFRRQADLLDLAHDAVLARDPSGGITYWSASAAETYGYGPDEALGRNVHTLLGTLIPESIEQAEETLLRHGTWEGEVLQARRDGTRLIASSRWAYRPAAEGRPAEVLEIYRDVTARHEVERLAVADRARIEAIFQNAGVGIIEVDPSTLRFLQVNARFAQITGYSSGELLGGMSIHDITHPDDLVLGLPAMAAKERESLTIPPFEKRLLRKDGEQVWVEVSLTHATYGDGVRNIAVVQDVTARRAAMEALSASLSRERARAEELQTVLESVPVGVFIARDPEGRDMEATPLGAAMLRLDPGRYPSPAGPEDLAPTHFRVMRDGRELEGHELPVERAILTGEEIRNAHLDIVFDDGERRTLMGNASPLFDAEGGVRGAIGAFLDVTETMGRERTLHFLLDLSEGTKDLRDPEEILREVTRRLGEHLRTGRCAYAEVEADEDTFTIVSDWSPHLPSTKGTYPLSAFGPRAAADQRGGRTLVIHDVDAELRPEEGGDTFRSIGIRAIVCCPLVKEGRLAAMMAVHHPTPRVWTDEEVRLVEMVVARGWDSITRARAERQLRETNAALEARVRERTAELEQALGDSVAFSYSVSHDLRTPLRAIVGTSHILFEDFGDQLTPEARNMLERQVAAASRLAQLVDGLLDMARRARQEMVRGRIDMSELARQVASELAPRYPAVRVEVQDGMEADGDPSLIRLVWQNYLENALKFSAPGGTVNAGQERDGAFFVRDEGIGFDMAYVGKLFQPFQRLHRDDEFGGTGIGLANVRRIVERHGGRVWAEGRPGRGATFWFSL